MHTPLPLMEWSGSAPAPPELRLDDPEFVERVDHYARRTHQGMGCPQELDQLVRVRLREASHHWGDVWANPDMEEAKLLALSRWE